ncbi:glycosyltransferase [Rhodoferax aquaticus]|uniref:Glycosyltransferase n=1 Tax=Rhodoferax aquaticus TaxID=2527691 RepID=A0A515ENU0_9BURK|nr:glycosyltransferase [Rhodoferax aquaticus]QDL54300.1 glycosyltransferase [Rhodoferax aquaticus]
MSDQSLLSVVVTTYNRSETVAQVLRALAVQTDRQFEVVIADDGSNAQHQQAIALSAAACHLKVTHVWHPDVGFTASVARNRGVFHSSGNYIIFIDGDCVPDVDFIAQHRAIREADCFVNGSRVLLSPSFTDQVISENLNLAGRSLGYWLQRRICGDCSKLTGQLRFPLSRGRRQAQFRWRGIKSCNMGVWRHHFELVNGFDSTFNGWGHEDADFVLRLHNAHVIRKNGFCATEVYHLWHREANRQSESFNAEKVRSRIGTGQVCADIGYAQLANDASVVVRRWG